MQWLQKQFWSENIIKSAFWDSLILLNKIGNSVQILTSDNNSIQGEVLLSIVYCLSIWYHIHIVLVQEATVWGIVQEGTDRKVHTSLALCAASSPHQRASRQVCRSIQETSQQIQTQEQIQILTPVHTTAICSLYVVKEWYLRTLEEQLGGWLHIASILLINRVLQIHSREVILIDIQSTNGDLLHCIPFIKHKTTKNEKS